MNLDTMRRYNMPIRPVVNVPSNVIARPVNLIDEIVTGADGRRFQLSYSNGMRHVALQEARTKYGFLDPIVQPVIQPFVESNRKFVDSSRKQKYGFMDTTPVQSLHDVIRMRQGFMKD